jgi:hypothetical protein
VKSLDTNFTLKLIEGTLFKTVILDREFKIDPNETGHIFNFYPF